MMLDLRKRKLQILSHLREQRTSNSITEESYDLQFEMLMEAKDPNQLAMFDEKSKFKSHGKSNNIISNERREDSSFTSSQGSYPWTKYNEEYNYEKETKIDDGEREDSEMEYENKMSDLIGEHIQTAPISTNSINSRTLLSKIYNNQIMRSPEIKVTSDHETNKLFKASKEMIVLDSPNPKGSTEKSTGESYRMYGHDNPIARSYNYSHGLSSPKTQECGSIPHEQKKDTKTSIITPCEKMRSLPEETVPIKSHRAQTKSLLESDDQDGEEEGSSSSRQETGENCVKHKGLSIFVYANWSEKRGKKWDVKIRGCPKPIFKSFSESKYGKNALKEAINEVLKWSSERNDNTT